MVRVDPDTEELAGDPIAVGDDPAELSLAPDAVWVANETSSTVTRIEP